MTFAHQMRVSPLPGPGGAAELPKTATGKIQKYVLRNGAPNLARQ